MAELTSPPTEAEGRAGNGDDGSTSAIVESGGKPLFEVRHPRREERWLRALIYGEYGSGKTHLVGTASDVTALDRVMFIDVESGDLTLHRWPNMHVVPIGKYSEINMIFTWLKGHIYARDIYLNDPSRKDRARESLVARQKQLFPTYTGEEEPFLYRTVILDSLSELQRLSMYQLLGTVVGKATLAVEPGKAGWDEWGKSTEMIRLLIRSFRDLDIHTIMVCSEAMSANAEKKKSPITVNLPKKLAEDVPGFFDVVGYLAANVQAQTGTTERKLYLNPGQNFMAKNRFGFDKQFIADPTMAKVLALVK